MPEHKGQYAMNPAVARRKGEEAAANTSKKPKEEKEPEGKLERIEIKTAANGFTVECSYRKPKSDAKKGDSCCIGDYQPPVSHVFESVGSLVDFLREELEEG